MTTPGPEVDRTNPIVDVASATPAKGHRDGAAGRRDRSNNSRAGGIVRIFVDCRPVLAEDVRKLYGLVGFSFVIGLLEAVLILLVVQMAVALAAGRDHFDVSLGPASFTELPLLRGVAVGLVLVLVLIAFLFPVAALFGRLTSRAQHRTRKRLINAYLAANWEVRSHFPDGHLQDLLTTYAVRAEAAVNQLLVASVALCGLTSILLVAFATSASVAAIAIVCVGGVGVLLRPVIVRTRKASVIFAQDDHDFAARMAEIARVTPEIAAFDVADSVATTVDERAGEVAESLRQVRMSGRLGTSLYQYLALLLIVLAIGAVSLFADAKGLATMGTVLLLLVRAFAYGQQLQGQMQAANETGPFLERMATEVAALKGAVVDRSGSLIGEPTPLRFDDVWFAYAPPQDVLRGVSFEIRRGEILGIVGRSGAGKSTLVQLLLRLRQPYQGQITACGVALDDLALACWYELVAFVPQENRLITGTVADNIRFFRSGLDDATIHEAARRAHLYEEIESLPQGFDTPLGSGVRDLSGGQRQRLGIARALAGSPRLVILDEPTSSLDSRSEALVAQTLDDLRGSVTTVIVAHRAATTAICDRIIRIESGRALPASPASGSDLVGDATS